MGLVALRGRWTLIFFGYVVAHRRARFLEFWIKFSRVSFTYKRVFRRRSAEDLRNLRSGSQIFDKCMCHACHDVCGVCGEDRQVGHCEDKSILYSSSSSSFSFALSIPNSNCSSATCG